MNRWDSRAHRWDQRPGEIVDDYLQKFETRVVISCPRELTEQEKCIMFQNGLLESYKPHRNPDTYSELQELVTDAHMQGRRRHIRIDVRAIHSNLREGPSAEET